MTPDSDPYSRLPTVLVSLVAAATCALGYVSVALAQGADRVTIDARRCMDIESAEERLACFETAVEDASDGRIEREPSSSTIDDEPAASAEQPPAAADTARASRRDTRASEPPNESVGVIASLSTRAPNRYLITLDNGEVWEQRVAERYPLRVGQRVRVYASRWGDSRRLEVDGLNGFIQVQRVR
jgi:hypothetical protein